MSLPLPIYSVAQVRELERRAIEACRIPSVELMTRAGAAAFGVLRTRFPQARRVAVVCGPGNNGGDGYVVARLTHEAGLGSVVLTVGRVPSAPDAMQMRRQCEAAGVKIESFQANRLADADLIVDALFGIGLTRPVDGAARGAIEAINASGRAVLAIDVPSGLNADTGAVMGAAVQARVTVSFIGLKAGLFTADACDHTGEIIFDDLTVPLEAYAGVTPLARRLAWSELRRLIRPRRRNAHKGDFGHVLVIGGGKGMSGAARLCGEAALRAGAGLVTVATHPSHAATINAARPELLVYGVRGARDLKPLLDRATVVAVGPGLSQDAWARSLWRAALDYELPVVLDADGLNLLAAKPLRKNDWVLTPHPGEAARLLKTKTPVIQSDRFAAVRNVVRRYGGVAVLKGAGTLIAGGDDMALCDCGNPGMASGGMGDVLTGLIAALRAQGLSPFDAARLGVWLHATAGDDAAKGAGQVGLIASDIYPFIHHRLNQFRDEDN